MHPALAYRWADRPAMLAFVGEVAFVRVIAATPAGLRVAHTPVILTVEGRLRFHLANANAMTPHLDGADALLLSEGPDAYVSRDWCGDPVMGVPSWNYVAVECDGHVDALGRADLSALLDDLARTLEPRVGQSWTRAHMDPHRWEAMLGAITAFEFTVTALRGTRKLSQKQNGDDLARILAGCQENGAYDMAAAIRAARA